MIELVNFTKYYGRTKIPAVQGFSMTCKPGTVTGLLGLNGAGKTTVLKAVCARHFATKGAVRINGIDAAENAEKVRSMTGFVSEMSLLPAEYTVEEFLMQRAQLYGIEPQEALFRVIKQCALEEVASKKIKTLSKGFSERVNFAQALIHNPAILVLDEPASGLDPAQIVRMRSLVKSLLPEHTVLLSTHLMQEVDALCDYVYILHQGRCIAHGNAKSIAQTHNCTSLEEAFFKLTAAGQNQAAAQGAL